MKIRALSIFLSIAMVFSCLASITSFSAYAEETTEESVYTIAGNNEELFGLIWYKYITKDNTMQKSGDVYVYELKDVQVQTGIKFSIVEHKPDGTTREYGNGPHYPGNFDIYSEFRVAKACDVTITFNPETHEIKVLGDGVREIKDDTYRLYAYSMNCDTFGIDTETNPYPLENEMTEDENGIYSVTFRDVQPQKNILINISAEVAEHIVGFTGYNYCAIDVTKPCDVTVYFLGYAYSEDAQIWAEGDGVVMKTKPEIGEIHLVGGFTDYDPTESNKMTQTNDYVFTYRADKLTTDKNYGFQFYNVQENYNDMWYGANYDSNYDFGTETPAYSIFSDYGACFQRGYFSVPYDNASVLITFDLTNFDYISKQNASYRIDLIGDVCGDGKISVTDATELQKSLSEITELTDNQNTLADVNGDGEVNVKDVTAIQKIAVQ